MNEGNRMTPDLTVIVPAYNESRTVGTVIDRLVHNLGSIAYEILVVDDASKDDTAQIVRSLGEGQPQIRVISHNINQGKTQALVTGFKEAQGRVVIVQDADLEYPADMLKLVTPILEGRADVVYGSRLAKSDHANQFMARSYFANKVITFVSNLFTRYKFSDVETCYKAFRCEIIQNMIISSQRFGFEIEVTAKISKLDLKTAESPITFASRSYEDGKKIGVYDGLQALWYILKYNLFTSKADSFTQVPDLRQPLPAAK